VQIEDEPATLGLRVVYSQLYLLVVMRHAIIATDVNGLIHPETLGVFIGCGLLRRGSLTVDLGGLTMPCTSFYQPDSSGYFSYCLLDGLCLFVTAFITYYSA